MKVELRGFDDDGSVVTLGTILLKEGELSVDTSLAQGVLLDSVRDFQAKVNVTKDEPERFLSLLHLTYHGSRLWATRPIE